MQKLSWIKYLTREYSFLYISYATDCYRLMPELVGTSIKFDLAHGQGDLVTLYGVGSDFDRCYNEIEKGLREDKNKGIRYAQKYEELYNQYFSLVKQIENTEDSSELKRLLLKLDGNFLELLCYYLYFVYLGYGGERPAISNFFSENKELFEHIRNSGVDTHMDKQFPRLFSKLNSDLLSSVPYFSRQDLLGYLEDKKIDLNKISDHKAEYLLITKDGLTTEYDSPKIKEIISEELGEQNIIETEELKGRTAYKGVVQGIVRIILLEKDYAKIQTGDIVVTPMTKPTVVPYLSKVKGIVTNDGGALCHASIISREMNIPCIVGTVHATEVFKDGDIVEVDASKGIIRKV